VRKLFLLSVAAAVVVGIGVGLLLHDRFSSGTAAAIGLPALHGQATWAPGKRPAPQFALHDQHGQLVSLHALQGRTVVLTFLDSLCKQACPIEGKMLAAAIRQVPTNQRPRLVVVSVDPSGDTSASIAHAIAEWHLPTGTLWARGTHRRLAQVWRDYQITVDPVSGDIVHSTAVYLIDPKGSERAGFLMPFIPGLVAADLKTLAQPS
jgi:cytochrome oxidase Cu insertion factor (SCO1/SenC/PrrC family)